MSANRLFLYAGNIYLSSMYDHRDVVIHILKKVNYNAHIYYYVVHIPVDCSNVYLYRAVLTESKHPVLSFVMFGINIACKTFLGKVHNQ